MLQEPLHHFLNSVPQLAIPPSEPARELNSPPIYSSPFDLAIDRHPLTVAPETPIAEVLALMNPMRVSCQLGGEKPNALPGPVKHSCVLLPSRSKSIENAIVTK